jgi:hypothetical protein
MRVLAIFALAVAFWPLPLSAQQQHQTAALDPCKVIATPEVYAEKIVEVRGIIYSSFEDLSIGGNDCEELPAMFRIWLAYPDEREVKEDPALHGQKLKFKNDRASKKLDEYLNDKCSVRRVRTTLRGRLQYKAEIATGHPNGSLAGIVGYGHDGMYRLRLIMLSVIQAEKLPCNQPTP